VFTVEQRDAVHRDASKAIFASHLGPFFRRPNPEAMRPFGVSSPQIIIPSI
jgi:hypothetical protein